MVKDEDGVVTVSLYEDQPAATETPAAEEEKKSEAATPETATAAEGTKIEAAKWSKSALSATNFSRRFTTRKRWKTSS